MADEQSGTGAGNVNANANSGGGGAAAEKTTWTADEHRAELQREADRRVNEALKKVKAEQDALIADKTKDAEAKLKELSTRAEAAEQYGVFVEAANAAGIRNVKAAHIVARDQGFLKHNRFDADGFRKANPEFFTPVVGAANAGDGAGRPAAAGGMNAFIRAAAGR